MISQANDVMALDNQPLTRPALNNLPTPAILPVSPAAPAPAVISVLHAPGSATDGDQRSSGCEPRVLILGSGQEIQYNLHDIPEPPAVKINGDVAKLVGMWDDLWNEWDVSSPLILKGVPIPLKHWKSVYSNLGQGSKTWTGIKQLWHSWNVRVSYSSNCMV
jgi:hypothetical protein